MISNAVRAGKTVVMTTQVPNEGSDLLLYHVGNRLKTGLEVLEAYDMTTEAAVTKLMWALGRAGDLDEVRMIFSQNIAGEISLPQ